MRTYVQPSRETACLALSPVSCDAFIKAAAVHMSSRLTEAWPIGLRLRRDLLGLQGKGEGQQLFFGHDAAFSREVGEKDALDGEFGDDLALKMAVRSAQFVRP